MNRTKASLVAAAAVGLVAVVAVHAEDDTTTTPAQPGNTRARKAQPQRRTTEPKQKIDPKADALLRKMSTDLGAAKTFSFDTAHVTEVITADDQKLQVLASSSVMVQRPNKLRSDRKGRIGDVTLYYDGKNLTIYGKKANLYATAAAPDTLDKTIDFARTDLDLEAPAADLLYSDVYSILMEDAVSGMLVDEAVIDGRMCKQLAYRGTDTDWQIWIEDGQRALPCRFVITTKDVKGWPQYVVEMSNWKVSDAPMPDKTFAFTPPKGAGKIDFLSVSAAQRKQIEPKPPQSSSLQGTKVPQPPTTPLPSQSSDPMTPPPAPPVQQ